MPTLEEYVEVYDHTNIASYSFTVPSLALWTSLLARMLILKDRDKFSGLIAVCVMMILQLVSSIVLWQLFYTFVDRLYKGDLKHYELANQITQACFYTTSTTFNLAHWFFAFSYFALSVRLELIAKGLPENSLNSRLNAANAIVCLFNVAIPAIFWIIPSEGKVKAAGIVYDI